eukprot:m.1639109 g.1639109  ORF g.1639109 m.1639109 type:complete len:380 (-) comp33291_c0_seq1:492-1631(-)
MAQSGIRALFLRHALTISCQRQATCPGTLFASNKPDRMPLYYLGRLTRTPICTYPCGARNTASVYSINLQALLQAPQHRNVSFVASGCNSRPEFLYHWPIHHYITSKERQRRCFFNSSGDDDPYTILGVNRLSSDKDIKLAYLSKARQYHPDVCDDADSKEKFQKISQAYKQIATFKARQDYDAGVGSSSNTGGFGGGSGFDAGFSSQDAQETFDSVMKDVHVARTILNNYLADLRDDVDEVSTSVTEGEYAPLWDFVQRRKGLILSIMLPTLILFRMPAVALAAITVVPRASLYVISLTGRLFGTRGIAALLGMTTTIVRAAALRVRSFLQEESATSEHYTDTRRERQQNTKRDKGDTTRSSRRATPAPPGERHKKED